MDDLTAMNPGKFKRRRRSGNSTASVVDLPAITDTPSGSLLGDDLLTDTPRNDSPPKKSLLDLVASSEISRVNELADENLSRAPMHDHAPQEDESKPLISIKSELPTESSSPLDRLPSADPNIDPIDDTQASPSHPQSTTSEFDACNSNSCLQPNRLSSKNSNEMSSLVAQKARRKANAPSPSPTQTTVDQEKLDEILTQNREIQKQCIDTLNRLQNTNSLNEKRYALSLLIGFIVLTIVAVIGIAFGVKRQNTAKFNELRFNHEVYTKLVGEKDVLEREYEKEKQGASIAYDIFKLIEDGQQEAAVEKFNDSREHITHPAERELLSQRIEQIRWELAENAFAHGVMMYNATNFEQARDAFFKSIAQKENTSYAPRLNYYLAMSLYQLSDFEGARRYFALISPGDLNSEMDANARFYRAVATEKVGNDAEAFDLYDQFIKKYRYHKFADEATKRRAKLDVSKR